MHLLASLNSGFAAAANGRAKIFVRGTSTRATVYGDFEASTSDSSGADLTLDAYGSREVYVNQLVDVEVYDADGVLIRDYTDGYSSPNVEVISPAFTGTDYVSALSAVNEPTTLQAVLNLWATNAGAPDWKVLLNGSATTMLNAFGALSGLVFNVKSPAYGAVGDGVTNDQTAIAAALAAAVAAGGGIVFFPKGTYLITTAIEWDHRVSILGIGATQSVITTNSAVNARILTWTTGTAQTSPQWIAGMGFSASQANTGEQLYTTVAVNHCIERCAFGVSTNATGNLLTFGAASKVRILNSRLTVNGTAKSAVVCSSTMFATIQGCHIDTGNATYTGSFIKSGGWTFVSSCIIDQTLNTLGISPTGIEMTNSTDVLTVRDTQFIAVGQSFTQCVKLFAGAKANTHGNDFGFSVWYNAVASPLADGSLLQFSTEFTVSAGTTIPDYHILYGYTTAGAAPTFTMPTKYFSGQTVTTFVTNSSGGGWTPTYSGVSIAGNVTISAVGAGSTAIQHFQLFGTTWRAIGPT